nr:hypothetical protein [Kitasatospora sp. MMS16-BH015]
MRPDRGTGPGGRRLRGSSGPLHPAAAGRRAGAGSRSGRRAPRGPHRTSVAGEGGTGRGILRRRQMLMG